MQACAAGYVLSIVITPKLQLVSWTVVGEFESHSRQSYIMTGGIPQSVRLSAKPLETHDQYFF
jgi:hypothetical protein